MVKYSERIQEVEIMVQILTGNSDKADKKHMMGVTKSVHRCLEETQNQHHFLMENVRLCQCSNYL